MMPAPPPTPITQKESNNTYKYNFQKRIKIQDFAEHVDLY